MPAMRDSDCGMRPMAGNRCLERKPWARSMGRAGMKAAKVRMRKSLPKRASKEDQPLKPVMVVLVVLLVVIYSFLG